MKCIANRFSVGGLIGRGSFGSVYNGKDLTNGDLIAIKIEKLVTTAKTMTSTFGIEVEIYQKLKDVPGFPTLRWKGESGRTQIMVLDLLGENLHSLWRHECNGIFSLRTVSMIADQLIYRLQALHACGYVHRDIKPDNIVMGRGENARVLHLIDFGVSAKFSNSRGYRGYLPYASTRMHLREVLSGRDDLECLGYMLLHLFTGSLPWLKFCKGGSDVTAHERAILNSKTTALDRFLNTLPPAFSLYMKHVKNRGESLNYGYLRSLFAQMYCTGGPTPAFDWEVRNRVVELPPLHALPAPLPGVLLQLRPVVAEEHDMSCDTPALQPTWKAIKDERPIRPMQKDQFKQALEQAQNRCCDPAVAGLVISPTKISPTKTPNSRPATARASPRGVDAEHQHVALPRNVSTAAVGAQRAVLQSSHRRLRLARSQSADLLARASALSRAAAKQGGELPLLVAF